MKYIERSTDNKYCRELSVYTSKDNYSLIYVKETQKLEISIEYGEKPTINRVLPTMSIADILWLINGGK